MGGCGSNISASNNRMPTRVLSYRTPLDVFKTFFPACRLHTDLPLKVFGCTVFMYAPNLVLN